ncbi:hypothetical protein [Halosimplex salinum]|uniref:hypothetical protein n=1 Tax=Halosimplex salinum TaxID=1710538 RepID=UPI000F4AF043|nr:hypothetical protein [Halosimplex salinum]
MNRQFWKGVLIVAVVLQGILVASMLSVDSDSPTFVVSVLATVHLVAGMVIVGSMLYFEWDPFEPLR